MIHIIEDDSLMSGFDYQDLAYETTDSLIREEMPDFCISDEKDNEYED